MTVLVAVEAPGGVAMAWDSALISSDDIVTRSEPKGWIRSDVGVAFSGVGRPGQVIKHYWEPSLIPTPAGVERWVVKQVVPEWVELLKEHCPGSELPSDWTAVLAVRGVACTVSGDWAYSPSTNGYLAEGSGAGFALASLASTYGLLPADERARKAVIAASRHCNTVALPVEAQWVSA